jgi:hypothetical protein
MVIAFSSFSSFSFSTISAASSTTSASATSFIKLFSFRELTYPKLIILSRVYGVNYNFVKHYY